MLTEHANAAAGKEARAEYLNNKRTQHNSKAKNLLYGLNPDRPATPICSGKKSVPHAGEQGDAPFATFNESLPTSALAETQGGQMAKSFTKLAQKKDGAAKVGSQSAYSSDVYRNILERNYVDRTAQKTRNWGSAGLLGQHPATPQAAAGSQAAALLEEHMASQPQSRPMSSSQHAA